MGSFLFAVFFLSELIRVQVLPITSLTPSDLVRIQFLLYLFTEKEADTKGFICFKFSSICILFLKANESGLER